MTAKVLMMMGTNSSAGKSLLTAAACRVFARRGIKVAPFKAQNLSNNAAVCQGGGEIGRSQALQAMAAGIDPTTDMNPVLLKPEGGNRCQVVVHGRAVDARLAASYFNDRNQLWSKVTQSLDRLRQQYDLIIVEGAGSPAELNLSHAEIVNMSVAKYSNAAVLLIGDIERGGVFAQLLGTLWLLEPEERSLIQGLVVNKFHGDQELFRSGVEILQDRGQVPVVGVLPWIDGLNLPEEDVVSLSDRIVESTSVRRGDDPGQEGRRRVEIAVIQFPHIANFDDFDPLDDHPGVSLRYVRSISEIGQCDAVILPGTKNTLGDLEWLRSTGLATAIIDYASRGKAVVGICGGYQMLGRQIENPMAIESGQPYADGLGLLPMDTVFEESKHTEQVRRWIVDDSVVAGCDTVALVGYEIHHGRSTASFPWLSRHPSGPNSSAGEADVDGCRSESGKIWGCYLHGLFHNDGFREAWLAKLTGEYQANSHSANEVIQQSLDRLADAFEMHMNMDYIDQLLWPSESESSP